MGQETRGKVIWTLCTEIDCLGQNMRNPGHQRLPDSGKTHCNWVSPRLQLYFQVLAGKQGKGAMLSPAPDSATKFMQ